MAPITLHTSRATTLAVVAAFILTVVTSVRERGLSRSLLFVILGVGLPSLFEYHAINNIRLLRHHLQPQWKGVPLAISLGWYISGYNTFAMLESLAAQYGISDQGRRFFLPFATAFTATSMDLVTDVALLDQGYWEWNRDGSYASEIISPNGRHGIPAVNYAAWLGLTSLVTLLYLLLSRPQAASLPQHDAAGTIRSGRQAALLLLPTYLGSIGWELRQRRWIYILYSALFPLVLLKALLGKRK